MPVHVDGASGALSRRSSTPTSTWDFRLPRVASINTSGHKYGLVYPGVGWIVWRDADALPEDLIFWVNYLGDNMPTFALNFSRPGAQVVAQYYNFLRLGYEGYRRCRATPATSRRACPAQIAELGPFELITSGDELPVFAFTLKDDVENYTVFDVSNALRERGWQVPAYTFPKNREDLAALRVVVRRGFTHDLADLLVDDLERQLPRLQQQPAPVARRARVPRIPALTRRRTTMCRWLAYSGSPVLLEELLYEPEHSLIDQSLHSTARRRDDQRRRVRRRLVRERRNAWGVPQRRAGLERPQPARARRAHPLAARVRPHPRLVRYRRCSRRTATRSATAAGCGCTTARSPDFHEVKRDLVLAVDPSLYPPIEGSTDSEVFFFLALTFGLEDDPPGAVARAVGLIEEVGRGTASSIRSR